MSDWWNQPSEAGATDGSDPAGPEAAAVCPWCSAVAEPGAVNCGGCGAVIAQRESLGGLVIPGVTTVDPGLQPPSLTNSLVRQQTRMSTLNAVGQIGGASTQIAVAGVILAKGSIGGMFQRAIDPEQVGKPSQAAIAMALRLSGDASSQSATLSGPSGVRGVGDETGRGKPEDK